MGNPATTTLQHLILNLLVFVGLLTGLYFGVSDVLVGLNPVNWLYDLFLIVFFAGLYWVSRIRGWFQVAAHLICTVGLLLCAVNFLINAGIRGPTLMVFLTVLAVVSLLHRRRASLAYFAYGLSLAAGCLAIQYWHPEWILRYLSSSSEFWDVTMTFLFCIVAIFGVMRMLLGFFERILLQAQVAQATALQSEKMAALGEILANVSHEINNPVGVIGSALEFSRDWWAKELPQASQVLTDLTAEESLAFWALVKAGVTAGDLGQNLDSRRFRSQRTTLEQQLTGLGVPEPWSTAQDLVLVGLVTWDQSWSPLLANPRGWKAFEFAVKTLVLERSNRNASRAYLKLQSLVNALKAYSRSESPQNEAAPTNLAEGLDTVLTLYTASRGTSLEVVREYQDIGLVMAKADELIQVWTNLVQNALQAMGQGGTLTLTISEQSDWAVVTVSDTGPGIPENLRSQIFEPFFTTKPRGHGTGLGLGIVRSIVVAHGGTITIEDATGGGARFVVRLPLLSYRTSKA